MLEVHVNIKGQKALAAKFAMFRGMIQAGMPDAWQRIGRVLEAKIKIMTPVKTGQLVRSTKPRVSPMRVKSIASAIQPKDGYNYARIQHDGGKQGKIIGKQYMTIPLRQTTPTAVQIIDEEIDRIIALCGLG